jgi:hypothetical protein
MGEVFVPNTAGVHQATAAAVAAIAQGARHPVMRKGLQDAAGVYLEETRRGFESRTAGGFFPLAKSTRDQRRRQGFPEAAPILFRNGEIFKALYRGQKGNLEIILPDGIRVGIADGVMHGRYPDGSGGKVTLKRIALAHQRGAGRLPQRAIFYTASTGALKKMRDAIQAATTKLLRIK